MCVSKGWVKFVRGSIWWCEITKDLGCEHATFGLHPVLVISANEFNTKENSVVVLPLSSAIKYNEYKDTYQVYKIVLDRDSYIQTNAPRKIDAKHFKNYICTLDEDLFNDIMEKVKVYLGIATANTKITETQVTTYTNYPNYPINYVTTNTAVDVEKPKSKTKESTKITHSKSKFPIGYWKDFNHNVEFHNDYLTKDIDYCLKKYRMDNKTQFTKRLYNVRQFLLGTSYTKEDLKNVIEIKE